MATEDLTEFIKNSEVLIISDFEGTAPTAHFKEFKKYCETKKVIFMGDLFDSTVTLGDICTIELCENPELPHIRGCINTENYCALQTIKLMVDNKDNCRYVVGNRDINKIKLLPFFQFKDGSKWWKTNPATNSSWSSYEEIVNYLIRIEDDPWLISSDQDLALFKPFWNLETWSSAASIKLREGKDYKSIFGRFEYLFGKDPTVGSMSAMITIKSVPNELLQTNTIVDFIKRMEQKVTGNSTHDVTYFNKIRAALTIVLFMRMLDHELVNTTSSPIITDITQFGALDGYLYTYLTNALPAYYANCFITEKESTLLTFAHGGITTEFVEKDGLRGIKALKNFKSWSTLLNFNNRPKKNNVGGGQINGQMIKDKIKFFNNSYMTLLEQFLKTPKFDLQVNPDYNFVDQEISPEIKVLAKPYGKIKQREMQNWKSSLLILLQLTAGTEKIIHKLLKLNGYHAADSPIQTKKSIRGTTEENNDEPAQKILDPLDFKRYYNIFGHASLSSGYSFGKVHGSKKTYYINTDYSSTLFKESLSCEGYNNNYLLLVLDTRVENQVKLNVLGKVTLDSTKYKPMTVKADDKTIVSTMTSELAKEKKLEKKEKDNFYYVHNNSVANDASQPFSFEMDATMNLFDETAMNYSSTPLGEDISNSEFKFNGYATIKPGMQKFAVYSSPFGAPYGIVFIPIPLVDVAFVENKEGALDLEIGGGGRKRRTKKRKQIKKKRTKKIKKVKRRKTSSKKRT